MQIVAYVVKNNPGETNSLRRYISAVATYHCERQKLFKEILPNVAARAEVSVQNVRDELLIMQSLLPGGGADTQAALDCFYEILV